VVTEELTDTNYWLRVTATVPELDRPYYRKKFDDLSSREEAVFITSDRLILVATCRPLVSCGVIATGVDCCLSMLQRRVTTVPSTLVRQAPDI
jgi:hypothetical protein